MDSKGFEPLPRRLVPETSALLRHGHRTSLRASRLNRRPLGHESMVALMEAIPGGEKQPSAAPTTPKHSCATRGPLPGCVLRLHAPRLSSAIPKLQPDDGGWTRGRWSKPDARLACWPSIPVYRTPLQWPMHLARTCRDLPLEILRSTMSARAMIGRKAGG